MTGLPPPSAQFCLQYECLASAEADQRRLSRALALLPAASVILSAPAGAAFDPRALQPLIKLIQATGSAALIAGERDDDVARTAVQELRADGLHLPWSEDIEARCGVARRALGPGYIIGADAGRSRHDAMALAEAGVDYVGFGMGVSGEEPIEAAGERHDLVAWWAEIFQTPVVALDVENADDAAGLIAARADFISVRVAAEVSESGLESLLQPIAEALREPA